MASFSKEMLSQEAFIGISGIGNKNVQSFT